MIWRKRILFVLCLGPLLWVVSKVSSDSFGPDPGKSLVLFSGEWGLIFLLLALLVSPLKRWTGLSEVLRYRRMLGLYAFFYASIHLTAVFTYLLGWSVRILIEEFSERPYMALGILAWVVMLPLAATSSNFMLRRLNKYWKKLHQSVYLIAVLVCAHYIWLVRSDYLEAFIYSALIGLLLVERLVLKTRKRSFLFLDRLRSEQ